MDQRMIVGTFQLTKKCEINTIKANNNPSYLKVIKRHTRKISDLCENDINIAERSYQITVTNQEGHESIIDIVTNMRLEEIEGLHNDWNKYWCPNIFIFPRGDLFANKRMVETCSNDDSLPSLLDIKSVLKLHKTSLRFPFFVRFVRIILVRSSFGARLKLFSLHSCTHELHSELGVSECHRKS